MKKRAIALAAACCMLALPFAGCTQEATVYDAENTVSEDYRGNYDPETEGGWTEDIVIDGKLDEEIWSTKSYYTCGYADDSANQSATYRLTAFPGETGVFIGAQSYDTDMRSVDSYGSFTPDRNTGWEIYFFCLEKGTDQNIAQPTIIREYVIIDVNGNIVFMTGLRGAGEVYVEGELGSGETTGMSFELFIPYTELGVSTESGVPDVFNMLPIYRTFRVGAGVSASRMSLDPFPWIYTPGYYRFDENGYQNADAEGAVVGDMPSGFAKSANWDVSRESERIVESKGAQWQFIYFRDIYADNVIVKTDVQMKGTLATCDSDPKAGLMVMDSSQGYFGFFLNDDHFDDENDRFTALSYTTLLSDGWDMQSVTTVNEKGETVVRVDELDEPLESVELVMVKQGAEFDFYANGIKVYSCTQASFTSDVYVGFYSLSANAVYSNYAASSFETEEELAAIAAEMGIEL